MAEKEFILQGFTKRTHGDAIRELFDVENIQQVILSVAFVTESGVKQLEKRITPYGKMLLAFVGIRNDISSFQGLELLSKFGGTLYAVDTGARGIVFHPKVFLVRGTKRARMVIGSANLTLGGLNNNIEAGIVLDFDLNNAADKLIVDTVEASFSSLPKDYPQHVLQVKKKKTLDSWLDSGRLIDEMASIPPRPATSTSGAKADSVPRIKLKVAALRRALKKAKVGKKQLIVKATAKPKQGSVAAPPAALGINLELVWESKALTRRDLTIPTKAGTHATGSINLDKGLLAEDVDHRGYFYDIIFTHLAWTPTNSSGNVVEAFAKFQLIIKGISHGEFDLRIAHTTSKTSKSYLQKNAMTRLSWGAARGHIARPDLIDRTLSIYRDKADQKRFVLEID